MGRELYERFPVYAAAIDRADKHLMSLGAPFSLLEELSKDEATTKINSAHLSQPSCTAIQLALVDLLKTWNITPTSVAGHSSGEIGAAYSAGIIDFDDAMTVAYHRGRLIPILKEKFPRLDGSMMAVGAGQAEIAPLLERIPSSAGEVKIACINSPSSVTVSGDTDAIVELQRIIEEVSYSRNPSMWTSADFTFEGSSWNVRQKAPSRYSISFASYEPGRKRVYRIPSIDQAP